MRYALPNSDVPGPEVQDVQRIVIELEEEEDCVEMAMRIVCVSIMTARNVDLRPLGSHVQFWMIEQLTEPSVTKEELDEFEALIRQGHVRIDYLHGRAIKLDLCVEERRLTICPYYWAHRRDEVTTRRIPAFTFKALGVMLEKVAHLTY